jgi:pectate lyase
MKFLSVLQIPTAQHTRVGFWFIAGVLSLMAPTVAFSAPVISNPLPAGEQPYGTTRVTRTVNTDVLATCRVATTDIAYGSMTTTFTQTGGRYHKIDLNVANGQSYTRYIRCIDGQGSANTVSAVMSFSVAAGPAPVISNPLPAGVQPYGTTQVTLQVSTNEAATCRYHTSDVVYSSMSNTFGSTGGTTHQQTGFAVANGQSYPLFVRCINGGGFASTGSAVIGFSVATNAIGGLPAFPGAGGGGATSVGGRGGIVYEVTNLNDSGPGSLREGINMSGPRTIVFRVGGTIRLLSTLIVSNPYITIAGQTAPGGGILLSGEFLTEVVPSAQNMLLIRASDVIVRFVRFRLSENGDPCTGDQEGCRADNITIRPSESGTGDGNIILDHNSLSWATDENMGVTSHSTTALLTNLTISNTIIGEGLNPHSMGILLAGERYRDALTTGIDMHNNFFSSNNARNPQMRLGEGSFINNIVYLWKGGSGTGFYGGITFDIIGNIYKRGPGTDNNDILFSPDCVNSIYVQGIPSVYIAGNLGADESSVDVDNWPFIEGRASDPACNPTGTSNHYVLPESHKRTTPLQSINPRTYPITVRHVFNDNLEDRILDNVGASKRLDCMGNWVSNRDVVDQRLVTQFRDNVGIIPTSVSEVGGFPVIAAGTPCTDTDSDGMPDEWEISRGLNPNDPSDRNTVHASGYTMLEMYLAGPPQLQLSGLLPASGSQLARSINRAQIRVETTGPATCRWSYRPNVDWNNMTEYASTGELVHSGAFPVVSGGVYRVCNRCYDSARLEYSSDSCTSFSVEVDPKFMVW